MAKKRPIHCAKCNNEITIAKKGKHRYFICPECGIIATNPVPLIPIATRLIGSAVVSKIGKKVFSRGETEHVSSASSSPVRIPHDDDKFSTEEKVRLALK